MIRENAIDANAYLQAHALDYTKIQYKQLFHVVPVAGLLNDPTALFEFGGEYHMLYQTYPFGVKHFLKHKYHIRSKDLVHWENVGIAVSPEYWFELDGCCSGHGIVENETVYLFYTGLNWAEGSSAVGAQYQLMAKSVDGINFQKCPRPIIMPLEEPYTPHFRDPMVFKKDNMYYMLLAAQRRPRLPQLVMYRSTDLQKWEGMGAIKGLDYIAGGYMWECPSFLHLEDRDIIFISPQGMCFHNDPLNNYHSNGYILGEYDFETNTFSKGGFEKLDYGFDFYAALVHTDSKGRHICIAWMGLPEETDHPTKKDGYLHCLTLTTEITYKDQRLYRFPIPETDLLFTEKQILEGNSFEGTCYKLEAKLVYPDDVEFMLRTNGKQGIRLKIYNKEIILDRTQTDQTYAVIRKAPLPNTEEVRLSIYVDVTSVEIFVNDGIYSMTSRLFVDPDCNNNIIYGISPRDSIFISHFLEEVV